MPTSILAIDVQDESFKKFLDLYKGYQDSLGKMKAVWDATGKSIEDAAEAADDASFTDLYTNTVNTSKAADSMADAFAAGSIAAAAIFETLNATNDAVVKTEASAVRAGSAFGTIAGHTKSIAGDIFGITASLAKWAVFTAGAGVLGIGGSLFGLDALAGSASNQRRTAQGLGVSAGELNSFGTNLGRLVDPSMLNTVQGSQADMSQWAKFAQLGIPASEYMNADPAQLSVDIIKRAHDMWQQAGPLGHTKQWMSSRGLDQFMSFDDWKRIGTTSGSEISSDIKKYQDGTVSMGASDPTLRAWQDFQVKLSTSGKQIQTVLIDGLVKLTGPLGKLSSAVETALAGFLASPNLQILIGDLTKGIGDLSKWLSSPQFISGLDHFAGIVSSFAVGALNEAGQVQAHLPPALGGPDNTPGGAAAAGLPSVLYGGFNPFDKNVHNGYDFTGIGKKYGLTPQEVYASASIESGVQAHGPDSVVNGAHYQGMFQLGSGVQSQFGVTNPYDANQSANAYGMDMQALLKKYSGNIAEALASYDGDTHVDSDIKKYGAKWIDHAKPETQNYIKQFGKINGLTITIMNQTGAQTAILANAALQ